MPASLSTSTIFLDCPVLIKTKLRNFPTALPVSNLSTRFLLFFVVVFFFVVVVSAKSTLLCTSSSLPSLRPVSAPSISFYFICYCCYRCCCYCCRFPFRCCLSGGLKLSSSPPPSPLPPYFLLLFSFEFLIRFPFPSSFPSLFPPHRSLPSSLSLTDWAHLSCGEPQTRLLVISMLQLASPRSPSFTRKAILPSPPFPLKKYIHSNSNG